jgi:hypothetical protein
MTETGVAHVTGNRKRRAARLIGLRAFPISGRREFCLEWHFRGTSLMTLSNALRGRLKEGKMESPSVRRRDGYPDPRGQECRETRRALREEPSPAS